MKSPTAFLVLPALLLTGCAPVDERVRERREYREAEHVAEYLEFRKSCRDRGGLIHVEAHGRLGRKFVPRRGDRYRCL